MTRLPLTPSLRTTEEQSQSQLPPPVEEKNRLPRREQEDAALCVHVSRGVQVMQTEQQVWIVDLDQSVIVARISVAVCLAECPANSKEVRAS